VNNKLWAGIFVTVFFTVVISIISWLVHIQINKADKLEATDRWTGAQMVEYKIYVEARLKYLESSFQSINDKLDTLETLLKERGTSRGSESE